MSLRDAVVLIFLLALLPFAARRPFWGLLYYTMLAYLRPQDLAWGLRGGPYSKMAAAAVAFGVLLTLGQETLLRVHTLTILLTFYFFWIFLSVHFALYPEVAQPWGSWALKLLLLCLLTTGLIDSELRLRMLWAMIACSLGLLGLKYALFSLRQGGVRYAGGPIGSLTDNNTFAVALVMAFVMLLAMATSEKDRRLRWAALILSFACPLTVVLTFSRGGFLTLATAVCLLSLRSRRFALLSVIGSVGVILILLALPNQFRGDYVDRLGTIANFSEDASAMNRLTNWEAAWGVFLDHPTFGVGPRNFPYVAGDYDGVSGLVAHNTYLELLAESGWPSLLFFLLIVTVALFRLNRIYLRHRGTLLGTYASAIQVAIAVFLVGATFLDYVFYELVYHLAAIVVPMELLASEAKPSEQAEARSDISRPSGPGWWKERLVVQSKSE